MKVERAKYMVHLGNGVVHQRARAEIMNKIILFTEDIKIKKIERRNFGKFYFFRTYFISWSNYTK